MGQHCADTGIYTEDPIDGTVYEWDSYVTGKVLMEPKFTVPYNIIKFINGIVM